MGRSPVMLLDSASTIASRRSPRVPSAAWTMMFQFCAHKWMKRRAASPLPGVYRGAVIVPTWSKNQVDRVCSLDMLFGAGIFKCSGPVKADPQDDVLLSRLNLPWVFAVFSTRRRLVVERPLRPRYHSNSIGDSKSTSRAAGLSPFMISRKGLLDSVARVADFKLAWPCLVLVDLV